MTVDLYVGEVMHRQSGRAYEFVYQVFNIVVDIDKLRDDALDVGCFYNGFNLFSFYDRDHGARDGSTLRPWVEKHLADAGLATLRLTSSCSACGFWATCSIRSRSATAQTGGQSCCRLVRVKNTFGDQHGYLFL